MLTFFLIASTLTAWAAQPQVIWERTYGGDGPDLGNAVLQTADGGYIVAGSNNLTMKSGRAYLTRTGPNGDILWEKTYGRGNRTVGRAVLPAGDGGYILVGTVDPLNASSRAYAVRTDPNGNIIWEKTYGDAGMYESEAASLAPDGGFVIAGYTWAMGNYAQVFLIKADAGGNEQWARMYGGNDSTFGASVRQTADGGYVVAGQKNLEDMGDGRQMYLIKTGPNGDVQWEKTYGGDLNEEAGAVWPTTDGGYAIAGWTTSYNLSYNMQQVYLVKTDPNGNEQWNRTYGGAYMDRGNYVCQADDGGYVVSGSTSSLDGHPGALVLKTDRDGAEQWHLVFSNGTSDDAFSIIQASDGAFVATGKMDVAGKGLDMYLVKISGLATAPGPSSATGGFCPGLGLILLSLACVVGIYKKRMK